MPIGRYRLDYLRTPFGTKPIAPMPATPSAVVPLPPNGRARRCTDPKGHLQPIKPIWMKRRVAHPTIAHLAYHELGLGCRSHPPDSTVPSPIGVGPAWSANKL
jgi:hypothetical protein